MQHDGSQEMPGRQDWLWSTRVMEELRLRGMPEEASALADRQVATRYDGPAVEDLGDAGLLALVHRFAAAAM